MVFVVKTISIVMMVSSVVFLSAGPIASVVLFSHLLAFSRQVKVKKKDYIFSVSVNHRPCFMRLTKIYSKTPTELKILTLFNPASFLGFGLQQCHP